LNLKQQYLPQESAKTAVVPKTYQQGVMENGKFTTKTVTVGGGEIKAPTGNEKQDFKTNLDLAIKTPTATPAEKIGNVVSILAQPKWPTGTNWIKNIITTGYSTAADSVKNAADKLGALVNVLGEHRLSETQNQPGWSKYNADGTENPNYAKELKANQDYLDSLKKITPVERASKMGQAVIAGANIGFLPYTVPIQGEHNFPGHLVGPQRV